MGEGFPFGDRRTDCRRAIGEKASSKAGVHGVSERVGGTCEYSDVSRREHAVYATVKLAPVV